MFKKNIKPVLLAGALALATAVSPVFAEGADDSIENPNSPVEVIPNYGIAVSKKLKYANGINSFSIGTFNFRIKYDKAYDGVSKQPLSGTHSLDVKVKTVTKDEEGKDQVSETPVNAGDDALDFNYAFTPKSATLNYTIENDVQNNKYIDFESNTTTVPGVYKYILTELEPTESDPNVNYSKATYTILVEVTYPSQGTDFVINKYVYSEDVDYSNLDVSKKATNIEFENSYNENKNEALSVEKVVAGNYGDKTKYFHFTGIVTIPNTAADESLQTNVVRQKNTETNDFENKPLTLVRGENKIDFYLKSGQKLIFETLPVGTTYSFIENDADSDNYKTAISGADDGNSDPTKNIYAGPTTEAKGKVTDATNDKDSVKFTNTKTSDNITTGVIINNMPYIALLGASGAGLVVLAASKKRSKK